MSRWISLVATSPSGKTLFVCRMCGRISPTPDKECKEPPAIAHGAAASCMLLEDAHMAIELMESGQLRLTHTVWSADTICLRWEGEDGAPRRVVLRLFAGDDLQDVLNRVSEKADEIGLTTHQRAKLLAEPTSSTE